MNVAQISEIKNGRASFADGGHFVTLIGLSVVLALLASDLCADP